jgi:hypothetical protein
MQLSPGRIFRRLERDIALNPRLLADMQQKA